MPAHRYGALTGAPSTMMIERVRVNILLSSMLATPHTIQITGRSNTSPSLPFRPEIMHPWLVHESSDPQLQAFKSGAWVHPSWVTTQWTWTTRGQTVQLGKHQGQCAARLYCALRADLPSSSSGVRCRLTMHPWYASATGETHTSQLIPHTGCEFLRDRTQETWHHSRNVRRWVFDLLCCA